MKASTLFQAVALAAAPLVVSAFPNIPYLSERFHRGGHYNNELYQCFQSSRVQAQAYCNGLVGQESPRILTATIPGATVTTTVTIFGNAPSTSTAGFSINGLSSTWTASGTTTIVSAATTVTSFTTALATVTQTNTVTLTAGQIFERHHGKGYYGNRGPECMYRVRGKPMNYAREEQLSACAGMGITAEVRTVQWRRPRHTRTWVGKTINA